MNIRLFLIQKRIVYAFILCALFSCSQKNNSSSYNQQSVSTISMSVPANPETDKRWNELKTYDVQYDGNNIILTVVVSPIFKDYYNGATIYNSALGNPIKEIYAHLTSGFRDSGIRHLYVSFYNGERDKYGNRLFPDAKFIMSFQIDDVKKYKSAFYFNEEYEIIKSITHTGYPNIPLEKISNSNGVFL